MVSRMAGAAIQGLQQLIQGYLTGERTTEDFAARFETAFNLELDQETISQEEQAILQELFDEVVWYSPFPDERDQYPGYRDEAAIRSTAVKAAEALARCSQQVTGRSGRPPGRAGTAPPSRSGPGSPGSAV